MPATYEEVPYLHLSAAERLLLAQDILSSVVAESIPLTPEQLIEMRRRAAAIDAGEMPCEDAGIVRERAWASIQSV